MTNKNNTQDRVTDHQIALHKTSLKIAIVRALAQYKQTQSESMLEFISEFMLSRELPYHMGGKTHSTEKQRKMRNEPSGRETNTG